MSHRLQRRLLERELELMTFFSLGVASDLELTEDRQDALTLVRALLAASLKLSRLLWPMGRRAGDDLASREAAELRADLGLTDDHPLAPAQTPPLADLLRLSGTEFDAAVDLERKVLRLEGRDHPLTTVVEGIRQVHHAVTTL